MTNNNKNDNEILSHIDKYGIEHKDNIPSKKNLKKKSSFEKKGKRIRKVLDLHGRAHNEVTPLVREAFHECKDRGVDTILIIHGVGYSSNPIEGPIIKKLVRAMLENELSNHVKNYRTALPKDGGEGATIITLRL
jgi:DNA-nicking Smr family endonuclease